MKLTKIAVAAATTTALARRLRAEGRSTPISGDYPSEDMEWTIAFGPGGGNDIMARTMVDILQKDDLYPENIVVENREGGSGATGWGYLLGQGRHGLRHLHDVGLLHHHAAAGRHRLDLRRLHARRPAGRGQRAAARLR